MAFYFEANGIQDDGQKRAIFLSRVGAKTYKLLRSLVAPSKPGDKSFQALCDALCKLHIPHPSATLQRLRFNGRVCQPGEPTSVFGSSLRELSEYCEFGESPDHMLRDRLVCGIADERIQRRLPAERELSFAKAWDIARAMEDASKKADEIQSGCSSTGSQATMTEVQYVQKRIGKSLPCYRCERLSATEKVGEPATFSFVSLQRQTRRSRGDNHCRRCIPHHSQQLDILRSHSGSTAWRETIDRENAHRSFNVVVSLSQERLVLFWLYAASLRRGSGQKTAVRQPGPVFCRSTSLQAVKLQCIGVQRLPGLHNSSCMFAVRQAQPQAQPQGGGMPRGLISRWREGARFLYPVLGYVRHTSYLTTVLR